MALQTQIVDVILQRGLDTKTNDHLAAGLLELDNAVFTEGPTITKRNGTVALSRGVLGAAALTAAERISVLEDATRRVGGDEVLLFNQGTVYARTPALEQWVSRGTVSPLTFDVVPVIRNTAQQARPDSACLSGVSCYVWEDSRGGVRATIADEVTGRPLLADVELSATGVQPRVIALVDRFLVVYAETTNIRASTISALSPTAWAASTLVSAGGNATARIDLYQSISAEAALLAFNGAGATIVLAYIRNDGSLGTPANGGYPNAFSHAEGAALSLTVSLSLDTVTAIVLFYANATQGCRLVEYFNDFTLKQAAFTVDAATTISNTAITWLAATQMRIFWETPAASRFNHFIETAYLSTGAGAATDTRVLIRSVGLASKAAFKDGAAYVVAMHDPSIAGVGGLQPTLFVLRVAGLTAPDLRIAGRLLPGEASQIYTQKLSSICLTSDGDLSFATEVRTQFVAEGNTTYSLVGIARVRLIFDGAAYRTAQAGDELLLAGGVVGLYDGQSVVESGFHLYPENITATPVLAGGSMADGTYGVQVVYEWEDNRGRRHRSAPSPLQNVVISGGAGVARIDLTIPTLRITAKQAPRTNVEVQVYTSERNGTVLYKTGTGASSPVTAAVQNSTTADTVAFSRTVADATIIGNEVLYTTGGIVENATPPSGNLIASGAGRAWIAGTDNGRRVFYSKRMAPGLPPEFSDAFFFDVDDKGGALTAIELMDDKTVLFKRDQIEFISGEGPDPLGAGQGFSEPILVTTDAGCISAKSVVVTPIGIAFQSAKGIYMLTRGLESQYVGAPVERYTLNATVVGAALVDDANEVRFVLDDGNILVWNYLFGQWSRFTGLRALDIVNANNIAHVLPASAIVLVEDPDAVTDNGQDIHMPFTTGWIKLDQLQGFKRFYRAMFLGKFYSNHLLRVRVAYDYQPFSQETLVFDPSVLFSDPYGTGVYGVESPYGGAADLVYQFDVFPKFQKAQAIQFSVEDIGSNTGKAYSLTGISLEIGLKQGLFNKLGAGKSAI